MIALIVYLVVLGLLFYCVSLIPLPAPFPVIIKVLFVLLAILILLNAFGLLSGGLPSLRPIR